VFSPQLRNNVNFRRSRGKQQPYEQMQFVADLTRGLNHVNFLKNQ